MWVLSFGLKHTNSDYDEVPWVFVLTCVSHFGKWDGTRNPRPRDMGFGVGRPDTTMTLHFLLTEPWRKMGGVTLRPKYRSRIWQETQSWDGTPEEPKVPGSEDSTGWQTRWHVRNNQGWESGLYVRTYRRCHVEHLRTLYFKRSEVFLYTP